MVVKLEMLNEGFYLLWVDEKFPPDWIFLEMVKGKELTDSQASFQGGESYLILYMFS